MRAARDILLFASLCLIAACGGEPRSAGGAGRAEGAEGEIPKAERYGGTAVVAGLGDLPALNELVTADVDADQVQSFVLFTTLIQYDERLEPIPYLAERWDTARIGPETITLTFHLRRDVRWHDGMPTTAHDVKFTFDRAKDPAWNYPNSAFFTLYDSARVVDDHTITFFLKPHADYMDVWRVFSPMPKHILENVTPEEMLKHPFNTERPVGNGPFRFVSHTPQDRWVFEANPDFPQALGGRPYLDRLVYRVIPEQTTILTELLTGGVDVDIAVLPEHARRLEESPDVRLLKLATRQYVFLAWNGRRALFASPATRRAFAHAIDRQRIVDAVRHGLGTVANGPIPPFHWAFDREVRGPEYHPDSARAILERQGWRDRDGDGIRERDGVKLSFELKTNQNRVREDIVQMVQADLKAIGVEVRPRVMEWSAFVDDILRRRRFDAIVLGWVTEFRIDDTDLFACHKRGTPTQFADYCNPRVDSILAEATRTTDRARARALWREYQEILVSDQPFTWIYYEVRPVGVSTRLRDAVMDIRGTWINAKDWWIAPRDRGRAPRAAGP